MAFDDEDHADITSYTSALGFPSILECASFDTFAAQAASSPQQTRYRLHCCADLLAGFAAI
jgi:hypothetical protein